jgi:hypothetical protein
MRGTELLGRLDAMEAKIGRAVASDTDEVRLPCISSE